jgi:phospholipid transport system substrate-binding protein
MREGRVANRDRFAGTLARALFVVICGLCGVTAVPAETPVAAATTVITRLQAGLLRTDREQAGRPVSARVAAFMPLIAGTHDLDYMGRLTLGQTWSALAPSEQQHFLLLFRELSVIDYARRFRDTGGAGFEVIRAEETAGSRVQVDTVLKMPGETSVSLQYVLHATPSGWRIVNIVAAGVSDLALQRSQYRQILATSGFNGLVTHLEHLKRR